MRAGLRDQRPQPNERRWLLAVAFTIMMTLHTLGLGSTAASAAAMEHELTVPATATTVWIDLE